MALVGGGGYAEMMMTWTHSGILADHIQTCPPSPPSTPHHYHLFTSLEQVTNAPEKSLTCSQIQSRADIYAIISQSISDSPNLVDCTGYFIVIQTSLIKSK